ncbi:hypothetical protein BCR44DRAFT_46965 [Catenaria anguillulae PL171]|uniref:DUF7727 domain-containing protein n=1 Tax=Catenaria anguillulae PL171 TaxID=765915 RepID=A0A1Y2HJB1_9FUNG|nr:hypothetical protein BCR44DRAFT_46965 [Catenaria anguillulae PL171]
MGQLIWSLWGNYMALTSAAAIMDGGLWSILYNYPTVDQLRGLPIYNGVSWPGMLSMIFALVTVAFERSLRPPVGLRAVFYLIVSLIGFLQFSTVVGAQCYFCTSIVFMTAAFKGETGELDEDRKMVAEQNRGVA